MTDPPSTTLPFDAQLQQYAEIVVQVGLNLSPGQRLIIDAPLDAAPFVRRVAEQAYRAGARLVDVQWTDEALTLIRLQHAPRDSFEEYPEYRARGITEHAEQGHAWLTVHTPSPDLLAGQDHALITTLQRTQGRHLQAFRAAQGRGAMNWCVVSVPSAAWAGKVFPDVPAETAQQQLWDAVLRMVRADRGGGVHAWEAHVQDLLRRRDHLNAQRYAALRFHGPGTKLRVGLAEGHAWVAGQLTSRQGQAFVPNLPTEEVFTTPHRERVDGTVQATRPLEYAGTLIEGIRVRFEQGRVVEAHADSGQDVLRDLLATDDGSARLGEVALVATRSPVYRSGLLFYNTLYDENAASHLALGSAYAFALQGGSDMTPEERRAAGANSSLVHVDWMIGSGEVDVDGERADGTTEPLMRQGNWVF